MLVISIRTRRTLAVLRDRQDGIYLLPAATQFETCGSVTASNRSLQWREKVMEPLFESLPDHVIMYKFAKKLGFAEQLSKHIKVNGEEPLIEDILREINRGVWTIGYTGQSPERLKLHLANTAHLQYHDAEGRGRPLRRRILRPALALLGHAGDEAPRHTQSSTTPARPWPRAACPSGPTSASSTRARTCWPRALLEQGFGDPGRLPGVHRRPSEAARLVGRPDRRRKEGSRRGQELEDRPVRRHPARRDQARLRTVRQWQGALHRLEFPGSSADPPRAAVHAAP